MPDLETTTSGTNTETGYNPDITSLSTTESGGIISINAGSFTGGYQYDVVSLYSGNGIGYACSQESSMTCHSSVAVMHRNSAFECSANSRMNLNNCAVNIAKRGIVVSAGSSVSVENTVVSICGTNYEASESSSISASESASVFPVLYGVDVTKNSSFACTDFETMTRVWGETIDIPTTIHFRSMNNSHCGNSSLFMTTKTTQGLSGPVMNPKPMRFMWSQIWHLPGTPGSPFGSISRIFPTGGPTRASYRFVPLSHSTDYSNIVGGSVVDSTSLSSSGLLAVIAKDRVGYTSVKPPDGIFKPEDGSGITGLGGLTGIYSISDLITSL